MKAIVIHSGGMDSSISLALAIKEFGKEDVLSLSFSYQQRHAQEQQAAEKICLDWGVEHVLLNLPTLAQITHNALLDPTIPFIHKEKSAPPNTLVVGRNGLMARLGAIYANHLGAHYIYMGVMELELANSGYRDCSRAYMDLKQQILRIDLDDPHFEIRTPLIFMTKLQTLQLAENLGILEYLLENTISCYAGIPHRGCEKCPACHLKNEGLDQYFNASFG